MRHDHNHHSVKASEESAALIRRYRASGLALKDFARQQGLPPGRLHYWLYQKHRPVPPGRSAACSGAAPAPAFRELKLAACASLVASWAAEVSLPGGLAVRFSGAASPAWIGSVVGALQQPC
jgi:hypothetical protein